MLACPEWVDWVYGGFHIHEGPASFVIIALITLLGGGHVGDLIDRGEGAADLRCLPGYFDISCSRLEIGNLYTKCDFVGRDLGAVDPWMRKRLRRHEENPFRQVR